MNPRLFVMLWFTSLLVLVSSKEKWSFEFPALLEPELSAWKNLPDSREFALIDKTSEAFKLRQELQRIRIKMSGFIEMSRPKLCEGRVDYLMRVNNLDAFDGFSASVEKIEMSEGISNFIQVQIHKWKHNFVNNVMEVKKLADVYKTEKDNKLRGLALY